METSVSIYLSNVHPYATENDILTALKSYGNGDECIMFRNLQNGTCSVLKFNFDNDEAIDNLIVLHAGVILMLEYTYTSINEVYGGIPRKAKATMFVQLIRSSTVTEKSSIQLLTEINQEIKQAKALEERLAEAIFAFED
jgi:hypothetical protein